MENNAFDIEQALLKHAENIEKWKPLVPLVSEQLLPIIDKMFMRDQEMLNAGFKVFQLDLELIETLCRNENEVQEHKKFMISEAKYKVSRWTYNAIERLKLIVERRRLELTTGDLLADEPTRFFYHFNKLRFKKPDDFAKLKEDFDQQFMLLWEEEMTRFSYGRYVNITEWTIETIKIIIREMFDEHCENLGYSFSKKFSRHNIYAYTKPIIGSWALFISADLTRLIRIVPKSSRGEWLDMVFGIVNLKSKKKSLYAQNNLILPCHLDDFLPLGKAVFMGRLIYWRYSNFRELESLINSYFILYQIIAEEFEIAVTKGVGKIEEEKRGRVFDL